MIRHVVVLFVLSFLLACRGDFDGDPPTGSDTESGTSSENSDTGDETSTEGAESDTDTSGIPEPDVLDEGTTDETGSDEPEPTAVWRFDGDFSEDLMNAYASPVGPVSFETTPLDHGARVQEGGYIDASTIGELALASVADFSLIATYHQDADAGTQILWSLGHAVDDGNPESNSFWLGFIDGDLTLFTETGAGQNHYVDLGPSPPFGQWMTLVFVVSDDEIRVFWEGELRASDFFTPVETTAIDVYFGGVRDEYTPQTTNVLDGVLDEIRYYDYALSNDEAMALVE